MPTVNEIKQKLKDGGRTDGPELLDMMEERAKNDEGYKKLFDHWLENGGTVFLRDALATVFEHEKIWEEKKAQGSFYPFTDAWMQLDTANYYVRENMDYN